MTLIVNTAGVDVEKNQRVLAAARTVFSRYGYSRTTMGDIAKAAGMSRPALYLMFPGKDEIFAAVVSRLGVEILETIREGVTTRDTLQEQLRYAFTVWAVNSYKLVSASPDARDLVEGNHKAVEAIYEAFEGLVAELLTPAVRAVRLRTTPKAVARLLVRSSRGLKQTAKDSEDLQSMLDLLISLTVAALVFETSR